MFGLKSTKETKTKEVKPREIKSRDTKAKETKKRRLQPNKKILQQQRAERRKKRTAPIAKLDNKSKRVQRKASFSIMEKLARLWGADVGIDLGTTKVLIHVKGRGIVLNEPSYVARYTHTKEVVAVGDEASRMLGRTPADIEVIRPMRNGVIADYDMTEYMLRYFMHRAVRSQGFFKPRVVVCIPSGITSVEKRAVIEATLQAGARKVVLIEEPLAAALGVGLDQATSSVAMVVDIGGGTTDIAVICQTGVVVSESLRIGSERFDDAIVAYLKKRKRLLIGKTTAENLKKYIGTVDRTSQVRETKVRGRDLSTGLPIEITVSTKDMQKAMEDSVQIIIEGIKTILEKTPPEMIADIVDHGIILTGGGVLVNGFDRLLSRSTGIAAYLAESPLYSVIIGTGRALVEMSNLADTLEELR